MGVPVMVVVGEANVGEAMDDRAGGVIFNNHASCNTQQITCM